jgi:competence protein ComEC
MLPVVHTIFGVTSFYQLLSPLLSVIFVPFYPLGMGLHLVGFGAVLDGALLWLFALPTQNKEELLPLWMMFAYVGLSLGAIWYKKLFYGVLGLASLYMVYLFVFV